MRVLNTSTLEVEELSQSQVPEYAILSHTWSDGEITLQDLLSGIAPSKKGFTKLVGCCKKAKDDGFKYCWIDTCCIDKTSSAELSEAINSMYQWYKDSCICYVYLEDVHKDPKLDEYKEFANSRWFTRGWTLQELIAPAIVEFYDASWSELGTRSSLQERLTAITRINKDILFGGDPLDYPVAVRMSWAALRKTSRLEDEAYCLLGLFGVNMPMLYGEGRRAFLRLQEEILRVDEDYTLFAWDKYTTSGSLLACSPADFDMFTPRLDFVLDKLVFASPDYYRSNLSKTFFSLFPPRPHHLPPHLTGRGLHVTLPLRRHGVGKYHTFLALLELPQLEPYLVCVEMHQSDDEENHYRRAFGQAGALVLLPESLAEEFRYTSICVDRPALNLKGQGSLRVKQFHPPIVRVVLDTDLIPEISCIAANLINLKILAHGYQARSKEFRALNDDANGQTSPRIYGIAKRIYEPEFPIQSATISGSDLLYTPGYPEGRDMFRFQFVDRVGVDLITLIGFNPRPCCKAKLVPSTELDSELLHQFPNESDKMSDRATVHLKHLRHRQGPGWVVKISIRRAGAISAGVPQYVLELTKEHIPT